MDPRISIVTLGVEDLDASREFYTERLGWPEDGSGEDIVFYRTGGTRLALYPRDALAADATVQSDGSGFRGFTLAHNVASKAAVDDVLAEAEAAGATIVKPPDDTFWGGYSGYFSDPDGVLWEVAWNPDFSIDS
jgi:hypothetical protein